MYTHTHTHTQWDNINLIKGGNPAICNNMGESGGHYAKWNKPDRERQILHGNTYMLNLKKKTKLIEIKSRKVVIRAGVGRWREIGQMLVKLHKLSVIRWIGSVDLT